MLKYYCFHFAINIVIAAAMSLPWSQPMLSSRAPPMHRLGRCLLPPCHHFGRSDATNAIVSTAAHDNAAHTIISAAANAIVITAACVIVVLLRSVGGRTTSHAADATMSVSVSLFLIFVEGVVN